MEQVMEELQRETERLSDCWLAAKDIFSAVSAKASAAYEAAVREWLWSGSRERYGYNRTPLMASADRLAVEVRVAEEIAKKAEGLYRDALVALRTAQVRR